MIKTYFKLTKNGTFSGEFEDLSAAFERARKLNGTDLSWKDDEGDGHFAFGKTVNGLRSEYEIVQVRKRA